MPASNTALVYSRNESAGSTRAMVAGKKRTGRNGNGGHGGPRQGEWEWTLQQAAGS